MRANRWTRVAQIVVVNVLLLVALLALVELVSWAAIRAQSVFAPGDTSPRPPRYQQAAHEGHQDWIWQHLADDHRFKFSYRVGLWAPPDYRSQTVNVSGGFRVSAPRPPPPADERVFVFGGSTMWGVGVRDEYTIPWLLNEIDGPGGRFFVNCGIPAFESSQEVLKLSMLLAGGDVPALAVFYDGANDITSALLEAPGYEIGYGLHVHQLEGGTRGLLRSAFEQTSLAKVLIALSSRLSGRRARSDESYEPDPQDLRTVDRAVEIYLGNLRFARRVGRAYGFEVVNFLQPYLTAGYEYEAGLVTDFERDLYETQPKRFRHLVRLFYEKVRAGGEVIDLSHALVSWGREGSYFDVVHLGPAANALIASKIHARLP